jgi:hypothetical protein
MARYTVEMLLMHGATPRDLEARADLAAALPDAQIGEPDDVGAFDVEIEAGDLDQALQRVWDAIASAGADDHVLFLEHPELPDHWRPRSAPPRR